MAYKTPPTIDSVLEQDLSALTTTISKNVPTITQIMLSKALTTAGIITPKVSLVSLTELINRIIIPTIQNFEGGWNDHPNDVAGSTMRGVLMNNFVVNFDTIFINTYVDTVRDAAIAFNDKYPNWKTDPDFAKKVMYVVLSDSKVAGLWIHKFFASASNRYPIAVMTEDPFLGFLLADCCWTSGPTVYSENRADFNTLLKQYGWNGSESLWSSSIINAGDKTPEIAVKCLLNRFNQIMRISKPESKNGVFRKSWLDRLLNDKNSNLMMMVKINEVFNLNEGGLFDLTAAELQHLGRKAAIYKTVDLEFPT